MSKTENGEVSIEAEELRKRNILIATPMYGAMCTGHYSKSCTDLTKLAMHYGVNVDFFFIFNESLITRARNYCVDEFMRNKQFTHLIFIDSDIGFDPRDVLALAALADEDSEYDILCGPYPKKNISWEKVKQAVDKGFADENPQALQRYVGDYVFNPVSGVESIPLNEPVEVLEGGTGFMCIRRSTFEKYAAAYPEFLYRPDHVRSANFDGTNEITAYFDCVIDPKSKRYLSEDYMFCQYSRNIGMKVWMCPWMQLTHMGSYNFGGSLMDLAAIGAAATADPTKKLK